MEVLDCRGFACPQPVVLCRDWIASPAGIAATDFAVIVDNKAAVENVSRFLEGRAWSIHSTEEGNAAWCIHAVREGFVPDNSDTDPELSVEERCATSSRLKTLVFIPTETLGRGDDELGRRLMLNFLATLPELGTELWRVVLVNGGVKLAAEGPVVEKLQALEAAGVSILVCGTCLDYYGLLDQKKVGETTNMLDIVTSMQLADKVIRP